MSDLDPNQPPIDADPNLGADDQDIVAEVEELTKPEADKDRDKVKHALIAAKRELKASNRRVKELEPVAARAAAVEERLGKAQPIIDAVITNPKLRAEAIRIAQGTRVSDDRTVQPDSDDDPDAASYAEDAGFYLADGQTPDVARARRVLTRLDQRHGRQTDERIRPLAGTVLGGRAEGNYRAALNMVDDNGVPLASPESLRETVDMLGGPNSPMLANPAVVELLVNNAIGLDRRKNRTPKPVEEPLYLERQGGGRGSAVSISPEEKRNLERFGISEKDYNASSKRLETGVASRRGIALE